MGNYLNDKPNVGETGSYEGHAKNYDEVNNSNLKDVDMENRSGICQEKEKKHNFIVYSRSELLFDENNQSTGDVQELENVTPMEQHVGNEDNLCEASENLNEQNSINIKTKSSLKLCLEHDKQHMEEIQSNKENVVNTAKKKSCTSQNNHLKRKSKKQIEKERLKIHSETQRLMREREISIPYHVPKQRTLREFLARKKNRANIPINAPSSKMVEIWRDIEESTRNAPKFFKSDSSSDSETDDANGLKTNSETENVKINDNIGNSNKNFSFHDETDDKISTLSPSSDRICVELENIERENSHLFFNTQEISDNAYGKIIAQADSIQIDQDNRIITNNHKELNLASADELLLETANLVKDGKTPNSSSTLTCIEVKNICEFSIGEKSAKQRTSDWVKDIPMYEKLLKPSKKSILLQKLNPKLLKMTPKLSGEPNSIINLENDKNGMEIGAKKLKQRFIENCLVPKQKLDKEVQLTVTSSEVGANGEITGINTEKLIYSTSESLNDPELDKPGAKLQRLREELKKKIEDKWEEEHKKRNKEMELNIVNKYKTKKVFHGEEWDNELYHNEESWNDESEADDEFDEDELEEDDVEYKEIRSKKSKFIDDEAEEWGSEYEELRSVQSESENVDEGDMESSSETKRSSKLDNLTSSMKDCHVLLEDCAKSCSEGVKSRNDYDTQCSLIPPYQPGGGMLHGGSELTQADDDSLPQNVLSPALNLSLELSPLTKNGSSQQSWDFNADTEKNEERDGRCNFVPQFRESQTFDLSDAYEFCSGKFPSDCQTGPVHPDGEESQAVICTEDIPSQLNPELFDASQNPLITICSNNKNFESKYNKKSRLRLMSDSSDDEVDLCLDDIDDSGDITPDKISQEEESDDESEKLFTGKNRRPKKHLMFTDDEESVESEEDEFDVEISSVGKQNLIVEGEPDGEIEYDSEENEMVHPSEFFEKEAELSGSECSGDEDEKGLDELDAEDGDRDNLDEDQVRSQLGKIHIKKVLDDDTRQIRLLQEMFFEDGDLYDEGQKREKNFRWKNLGTFFDNDETNRDKSDTQYCEDDEDEQSAKIRHEKELFFLQLKNKQMDSEDEAEETSLLKLGKVILEKSRVASNEIVGNSSEISAKTSFLFNNKRGSFLSRNEEFLSKLAKYTSNATDNILGPKHSKNFVFAAKSPQKSASANENLNSKRKHSSRSETVKNKKSKLEIAGKAKDSVLDRLS